MSRVSAEVALRYPDGTLVPVWNGVHAKEIAIREHGIPETIIERMVIDMTKDRT